MPYEIRRIGFAATNHPLNVRVRSCFQRAGFQRIRLWLNRDLSMLSFRFRLGKHRPFSSTQEAREETRRQLAEVGIELYRTEPFVEELPGEQVDGAFCPLYASGAGVAGLVNETGQGEWKPETLTAKTCTSPRRKRAKRILLPRALAPQEAKAVRRLCDRAWAATENREIEQLGPAILRLGKLADPALDREVRMAFLALLNPEPELDLSRTDDIAEWCRYLATQPRARAQVLAAPVHRVRRELTGGAKVAYEQLLES